MPRDCNMIEIHQDKLCIDSGDQISCNRLGQIESPRGSWHLDFVLRQLLLLLSMKLYTRKLGFLAGLAALVFCSPASAQFVDVSTSVGLSRDAKKSWGNPIWGDMNNDGF